MTIGWQSGPRTASGRAAGVARVPTAALVCAAPRRLLAACGDEDRPTPSAEEQAVGYRLRDVGKALEGAGLALVRHAAQARLARDGVAHSDLVSRGDSERTTADVIAAMPEPPADGACHVVWRTFRRPAVETGGPRPGDTGVTPAEGQAPHDDGALALLGGDPVLLASWVRPLG